MARLPMAPEGNGLLAMMRDSVAAPGPTACRLLALRPSSGAIFQAAILVSVIDALLLGLVTGGNGFVLPLGTEQGMVLPPLAHSALLLASLVLSAGALQVGGQILGGRGRLREALLVVVWLEVLALGVEVVVLLASVVLPPLAPLLGLTGLVLLLWCVVHFARVLHGFKGFGRTILSLILGALAVGIALSLVLGLLGFGVATDV